MRVLSRREMEWLGDQTKLVMAERWMPADSRDVQELGAALMRGDGPKVVWIASKYGVTLDD